MIEKETRIIGNREVVLYRNMETGLYNVSEDAIEVFLGALEKQIPQQVKLYIGQDMQCPECNKRLRGYEGMKICYCKCCGKALER